MISQLHISILLFVDQYGPAVCHKFSSYEIRKNTLSVLPCKIITGPNILKPFRIVRFTFDFYRIKRNSKLQR